jgi:ParB family chromosome partitioning protein
MASPKKNPRLLGASFATLHDLASKSTQTPAPEIAANNVTALPSRQEEGQNVAPALSENVQGYATYDPSRTYKAGDHVLMPLELLEENPKNPRVFYVEKKTQELVASLAANGQMESGLVYPKGKNGKFRLKGGHRRRLGLQLLNREYMKVEIVEPSTSVLEEYRQARALNSEHQTHTHIDDALRFAELIAEGAAPDQNALCLALNVTKADMSKGLSIAEMPRLILEPMAEHIEVFGLSSAYCIFRFWKQTEKDEDRTLALVQKVIEGRLSVRALDALVKDATATKDKPAVRREHAVARALFSGTGEGELKSYAAGKLTLHLTKLDPEYRDQVYTRLAATLKDLGLTVDSGTAPTPENES